ncbi:hypothetical protein P1X14_05515 [Sphingomonas sp. AOB5]|uniref:hypothetical protein n=1 Tax=Sphingomonas sp. AOB5 TaxID=3034017 RepID=UPI0023F9FBBA|nr:hypothetical protein [Sphingomonas sp. AOB5]MDF7774697.1 hypothetical protein [Sphingomonas sp. AOB5]
MHEDRPEWDEGRGAALIGAIILVGITREGPDATTQEQFFGTVDKADARGIELLLGGSRAGGRYRLPPDLRALAPAEPGSYRLRSTGETLENPDFTATWTIVARN